MTQEESKKRYAEGYRKWLETRDMMYLCQYNLAVADVERIREEVYRQYCKDVKR